MANKIGLIWQDAQGQKVLHVPTYTGTFGTLLTALENHSRAVVAESWAGTDTVSGLTPSTASYPTVRVTAVLYFTDGVGSQAKLFLPAPNSNIFLTDGTTVDPAAIPDIIAAAVGTLLSGAGNPVAFFTGGELVQTRFSGIATA